MILVLLGTQNNSFHRLLEEVEKNIENGTIKEEVIAQKGYTKFESNKIKTYNGNRFAALERRERIWQ